MQMAARVAACLDWLYATRVYLAVVRCRRQARLRFHHLTGEEGLVARHIRVTTERAESAVDPELAAATPKDPGPTRYGFLCAASILFAITMGTYLAFLTVYALIYSDLPLNISEGIDALRYSRMLHVTHDPLAYVVEDSPDAHESGEPPALGPYPEFSVRTGMDPIHPPLVMRTPCRRLSEVELKKGVSLEGYVLPMVLMRMCELVHETVGCDRDGFLVPKYVQTSDDLNICVMTYKERDGVCQHYVNPVVRPVLSSKRVQAGVTSPHFDIPEVPMIFHSTALLSYQPIVAEQVNHAAAPDDAAKTRALSDAFDSLDLSGAHESTWLSSIPAMQTITVSGQRAFYYAIANAALLGQFPPEPPQTE